MADIFLAIFISSVIYGILVFAAGFCSAIYIVTKKYIVLKDYININTPLGPQRDGENTTSRFRGAYPSNQTNSKTQNYGNANRPIYQNTYNEGLLGNQRTGLSYLKPNAYNGYVNKSNYVPQASNVYQQGYEGNRVQTQGNYANYNYPKYNSVQLDSGEQSEYEYYDNEDYQYGDMDVVNDIQ